MGALQRIETGAVLPPPSPETVRLLAFDTIPPKHGVVSMCGSVMVYDEAAAGRFGLEDGALYVIEYQRPPGGMLPETYHRQSLDHLTGRRAAIHLQTSREVVKVSCWSRDEETWRYTRADGFTEWPMYEWGLASMIVGRVVGIYSPAAREVQQ
jgi:hypothetical protein